MIIFSSLKAWANEEKGHIFYDGFDHPDFALADLLLVLLPDFKTIIAG